MPNSESYRSAADLRVHPTLFGFIEKELLPSTGLEAGKFWSGLSGIFRDLTPRHRELMAIRDRMQVDIDHYHRNRRGQPHDSESYENFLHEIGYLQPTPAPDAYAVATKNVDAEIGTLCGPQLIAPLSDAHETVNGVNARWQSLVDVLFASDILPDDRSKGGETGDDLRRRQAATVKALELADRIAPLAEGSHSRARDYVIESGALQVTLTDGRSTALKAPSQLAGFTGPRHAPTGVLLKNNGLHVELCLYSSRKNSGEENSCVCDVQIESALSVVLDLEDSAAVSDIAGKVAAYRNWLRLMDGSIADGTASPLASDRIFTTPDGATLTMPGRAVALVKNVGPHLFTDAILDADGNPVPENVLDAVVSVASALQDLRRTNAVRNSRTGSVYLVKPKMHGPDELGLADALYKQVEDLVGLPKYTMKIGIMDEERRTSANLAGCMSKVRDRTVFINTGLFDRIGDEIHTVMEAGPVVRLNEMANAAWCRGYEAGNVATGIARNLPGRAQIGKGIWALPNRQADLLGQKIAQPAAGASAAVVCTPENAALHALHYHMVDVRMTQEQLRDQPNTTLREMLTPPVANRIYAPEEIARELDDNLTGLLGYVRAFVARGEGHAVVADTMGTGHYENRATARARSQHIANWLHHGLISDRQIRDGLRRLAPDSTELVMKTVEYLIFNGRASANGYCEATLVASRQSTERDLAKAS